MILRDSGGKIIAGDYTFADGLAANGTLPFEIEIRSSILKNIEGDWTVEIYASPW